jgi:hypothetical protein
LLGLDRLRLIAAAAKEQGEEVARITLGLEGQARSLKELVEAGVEDPAEVEAQLAGVSSRLETLETEKRVAQQRLLELQAAEASRKPLLAEVETLKQRLRKTDTEITETKRQIGRDESLLTGKKDLADLTERGATLATRILRFPRASSSYSCFRSTCAQIPPSKRRSNFWINGSGIWTYLCPKLTSSAQYLSSSDRYRTLILSMKVWRPFWRTRDWAFVASSGRT